MEEVKKPLEEAFIEKRFYPVVDQLGNLFEKIGYVLVKQFDPALEKVSEIVDEHFLKSKEKRLPQFSELYQESVSHSLRVSHYKNPSTKIPEGTFYTLCFSGRPDKFVLNEAEFFPYGPRWIKMSPKKRLFSSRQVELKDVLKLPDTQFVLMNPFEFLEAVENVFKQKINNSNNNS
jgi:hypothetical protein